MKLIKKLSDRDEQLSTLNAEKERCEQMNFTRKLPVDYYFDDYNSNQGFFIFIFFMKFLSC